MYFIYLSIYILAQTGRKRSRCEASERPDINGNMLPVFIDSPARLDETNLNNDNDFVSVIYFYKLYENFVFLHLPCQY